MGAIKFTDWHRSDSLVIGFQVNRFHRIAPESDISKKRTLKYGDFQVFGEDFQQTQLWSVNVAEATKTFQPVKPTRLFDDASLNVVDFS